MELRKYGGAQLWTRVTARRIRSDLIQMLERLELGETVVIDAAGVEVFDYSFANELFGKTLLSMPIDYPGRFVVVENLTEYTRENLAQALAALGLIAIEREGRQLRLIGKVHPADEETFETLAAEQPVTATSLGDRLNVNLTAMNERLTKLVKLGLARREKTVSPAGREQYQYSTLV